VSAQSLGLGGLLSTRKPYVGAALSRRDGLEAPERPELVGLVSLDGAPLRAGAHLVEGPASRPGHSQGHVTSVAFSPELDREIGLGLLRGGQARHGARMFAADPVHGAHPAVEIVPPHFVDPEGRRMRDAEAAG